MKNILLLVLIFSCYTNFSQSDRKNYLSRQSDVKDQKTKEETILKERVSIAFSESEKYFNFNFFDRKPGLIMTLYFIGYNDKIRAYKIAPNDWGVENIIFDGHSITFELTKPNPILIMFLGLEKQ